MAGLTERDIRLNIITTLIKFNDAVQTMDELVKDADKAAKWVIDGD